MKFLSKLLILLPLLSYSQVRYDKRGDNWYFGENAGFNFNSGALTNGQTNQNQGGTSTISDDNGNLQFYFDGNTIWNKFHRIVPGANNLGIIANGFEKTYIVPKPEDENLFYFFKFIYQIGSSNQLVYSILDKRLNAGEGGLIETNKILTDKVINSIEIIRHCNQKFFWLLTHEYDSNRFKSFLLDNNGISSSSVNTEIGTKNGGIYNSYKIGSQISASLDGSRIALAQPNPSANNPNLEIFGFDNQTGKVKSQIQTFYISQNPSSNVLGVEFSPNGSLIYLSRFYRILNGTVSDDYFSQLYQFKISDGSSKLIGDRFYQITTGNPFGNTHLYICDLQLGPDNKIYVSLNAETSLSIIQNPDNEGLSCNFQKNAVSLNGKKAGYYLSKTIPAKLTKVEIKVKPNTNGCNDVLSSTAQGFDPSKKIIYQWFFENNPIPNANADTLIVQNQGNYSLIVREESGCKEDKSEKLNVIPSIVIPPPQIDKSITEICDGETKVALNVVGNQIKWYNEKPLKNVISTDNSFKPQISSNSQKQITFFATQITGNNCLSPPDSINIKIISKPQFINLEPQISYCFNNGDLKLEAKTNETVNYEWETSNSIFLNSQSSITVNQPDIYQVTITNQKNCVNESKIEVIDDCFNLYVPEAFTPNNDGENDILKIYGGGIESIDLVIKNRWGAEVYSMKNLKFNADTIETWDGKNAENGTYLFEIEAKIVKDNKTEIKNKNGVIYLIK
ncbi:MAG: gliding motility-associated C-terminal domain-containing protein [Spirosomataceae bacterium]